MVERMLKIINKILDKLPPLRGIFIGMDSYNIPVLKCERCGHTWWPRTPKPPTKCPNQRCKSPYWNIPPGTLKRGRPKGGSKK